MARSTGDGEEVVSEIKGDLFTSGADVSLAHCVSEDMHMGKGIATIFKKTFRGVQELKSQGVSVGGCAVLCRDKRFIYYLVTKKKYFHKPTYNSLRACLIAMKDHAVKNGVKSLCMPRIGCGLDGLKWPQVQDILSEVYTGSGLSITVYSL